MTFHESYYRSAYTHELQRDIDTSLVRSVEPTFEPVTCAELRQHLRVDIVDEDSVLDGFITAARLEVERQTETTLAQTTWQLRLDRFPEVITLDRPPVTSVSSVEYVDSDGNTQTLSASIYRTDLSSRQARITEAYGESWPNTQQVTDAVTVTFVAGRSNPNDIDPRAKLAVKLLAAHWYCNREAVGMVGDEVALTYGSLIDALSWRVRV